MGSLVRSMRLQMHDDAAQSWLSEAPLCILFGRVLDGPLFEDGPLHPPCHHGPLPLQRERRPMAVRLHCGCRAFGGCGGAFEHPCLHCSHLDYPLRN
jgi:diadenosine tetraphosphatase ApaH/serine/threonine PP2A family protein phosphatase